MADVGSELQVFAWLGSLCAFSRTATHLTQLDWKAAPESCCDHVSLYVLPTSLLKHVPTCSLTFLVHRQQTARNTHHKASNYGTVVHIPFRKSNEFCASVKMTPSASPLRTTSEVWHREAANAAGLPDLLHPSLHHAAASPKAVHLPA